ncbi:unnamed protein product [Pseudo-nitzschia multistriata]|uniref:tRNA-uridine aminocarboxypropyltransferase n=1 Tax=Pseudo-nitzschia multistriata TaxID=183589 RepID=A0A448ZRA8_9STRA|nr:unnamed protein product [Pseudo-nitzschia multistriata]
MEAPGEKRHCSAPPATDAQKRKALAEPEAGKDQSDRSPGQPRQKKKRVVCDRCHRPRPQTCLCDSLPAAPILLERTEIVVLQHPLEVKNHKAASHRSVPLLELCLAPESLSLRKGRRFGRESLGEDIFSKIHDRSGEYLPVLVFPKIKIAEGAREGSSGPGEQSYREDSATVLSLGGLLKHLRGGDAGTGAGQPKTAAVPPPHERAQATTNANANAKPKASARTVLLLVLDATWKHAREMHLANIRAGQYPPHMLRLALEQDDLRPAHSSDSGGARAPVFRPGRFRLRGKASKKGYGGSHKNKDKHNDDGDPPIDESWMSTAECIAWIVSGLEASGSAAGPGTSAGGGTNPPQSLYEILMKPLDAMVEKWKSYVERAGQPSGTACAAPATERQAAPLAGGDPGTTGTR